MRLLGVDINETNSSSMFQLFSEVGRKMISWLPMIVVTRKSTGDVKVVSVVSVSVLIFDGIISQ